ncbi:hypothetical protein EMCRGX_G013661 [Ephydatia muelleri]
MPQPRDEAEVRRFLGLASYYRKYIDKFADIAAPLHQLTQKDALFQWTQECEESFKRLKACLTKAPVLSFPSFGTEASTMVLQTDASNVGLGAVLEQEQRVIGYASRTLTRAEANYSVIQRECLAIWLAAQKMEGLLCRWAHAIQEFSFEIVYRKGIANGNADALSRREQEMETPHAAMTTVYAGFTPEELKKAQKQDDAIQQLYTALNSQQTPLKNWKRPTMRQYAQLWSQLEVVDGIVCRRYKPGPTSDTILVPVLTEALYQKAMSLCHDSPTAGHQGTLKTWERIRQEAYWVNIAQDVDRYCRECVTCQKAKLPMPVRSTLTNIPIGRPWQMIAIDILEVPVSTKNNRYLLVIQDYFTKWADARPLKDQTAVRIKAELVKLFCTYGIPEIVHSDQGRNFESSVVQSTLDAFGVVKSRTTLYHPQGDGMVERFNCSLLQLLRTYVERQEDWEQHLPLALYAYRTATYTSTGVSSFQLMYGRHPQPNTITPARGYEATSYQAVLQAKMAELQDLVEAHVAESAHRQKVNYDRHSEERLFKAGDRVWLSVPTAGKLDPRWEGNWIIKSLKSPVTVEISDGVRKKVVHINRLPRQIQHTTKSHPGTTPPPATLANSGAQSWEAPGVDHFEEPALPTEELPTEPEPQPERRYPTRDRHAPVRFGY